MALREYVFGGTIGKSSTVEAGKTLTLNMERADGLKNINYDMIFEVQHDNSAAVTTDVYKFVKNFLANIKFQTGAGDNHFDLTSTEFLINQLIEEGSIVAEIDKTSGNDKISTVMLRWNFVLPDEFVNPMDTAFHSDDRKYNYVQLKITPQKTFSSVGNLTIDSINVRITERFKQNPTPSMVQTSKGLSPLLPLNKILKVKDLSYNSDSKSEIVELPKNTNILGIYAFVVDGNGNLVAGAINNVQIKNGNEYFRDELFKDIQRDNRKKFLIDKTDSLLDNVAFVDIAKGQITEGLDTKDHKHSNTVLSFDLKAVGANNILKVMYRIQEKA